MPFGFFVEIAPTDPGFGNPGGETPGNELPGAGGHPDNSPPWAPVRPGGGPIYPSGPPRPWPPLPPPVGTWPPRPFPTRTHRSRLGRWRRRRREFSHLHPTRSGRQQPAAGSRHQASDRSASRNHLASDRRSAGREVHSARRHPGNRMALCRDRHVALGWRRAGPAAGWGRQRATRNSRAEVRSVQVQLVGFWLRGSALTGGPLCFLQMEA